MSSPDRGAARFADHERALLGLTGPCTTPESAGQALGLAGDVLRRTRTLGHLQRAAEQALERVEAGAARAFVAAIDVTVERTRLEAALTTAFDSMLADDEDVPALRQRALQALAMRDKLCSVATALGMRGSDDHALHEKLALVDAGLSKKARMLVGLNAERRVELDALDPSEHAGAWWFAARAKCDRLIALYTGGETRQDAHVESCDDCRADVATAKGASKPAHLDAASLARREDGTAKASELAWMDSHAKGCPACRRALDALAVALPQDA